MERSYRDEKDYAIGRIADSLYNQPKGHYKVTNVTKKRGNNNLAKLLATGMFIAAVIAGTAYLIQNDKSNQITEDQMLAIHSRVSRERAEIELYLSDEEVEINNINSICNGSNLMELRNSINLEYDSLIDSIEYTKDFSLAQNKSYTVGSAVDRVIEDKAKFNEEANLLLFDGNIEARADTAIALYNADVQVLRRQLEQSEKRLSMIDEDNSLYKNVKMENSEIRTKITNAKEKLADVLYATTKNQNLLVDNSKTL